MHTSEWSCFARRPPISMNESSSQENCKIVINWKKTYLPISFGDKSPVLVCLNKSKKAKKGRCFKCNSILCAHVQAWNQELKKSVLKNLYHKNLSKVFDEEVEAENDIGEMGSVEESEDFETLKEHATEMLHLRYRFDQDVQQKLRKLDCSQFENLTEVISIPKKGKKCVHNNPWSEEDPVENEWRRTPKYLCHPCRKKKPQNNFCFFWQWFSMIESDL